MLQKSVDWVHEVAAFKSERGSAVITYEGLGYETKYHNAYDLKSTTYSESLEQAINTAVSLLK